MGHQHPRRQSGTRRDFQDFLDWCATEKIPISLAAGNDPLTSIDEKYPHKLGTSENSVITVGGVTKRGTLYENTSPKLNGKAGSMSVFAPAENIEVPGDPNVPNQGTSQAAAIVSGLSAYFYGWSEVNLLHGNAQGDLKKFIGDHAWSRVPANSPSDSGWPPERPPVVYNLAYGDKAHPDNPCAINLDKRDNSSASACSNSLNATSATFAKLGSSNTATTPTSFLTTTMSGNKTGQSSNSSSSTPESSFVYSTTTGPTIYVVSTVNITVTPSPTPESTVGGDHPSIPASISVDCEETYQDPDGNPHYRLLCEPSLAKPASTVTHIDPPPESSEAPPAPEETDGGNFACIGGGGGGGQRAPDRLVRNGLLPYCRPSL